MLDYAVEKGLCEDTVTQRDLFDTRIMNCVMPRPSEVVGNFKKLYEKSKVQATDYFYKERHMMKRLIEILEEIQPEVDYATCTDLIDGRHLDSLSVLALVAELEEKFDITIPAVEIVPDNFNSAESLWAMIVRLQEEA